MQTAEKALAQQMRRDGLSMKMIEQRLGVARSTVSLWVRPLHVAGCMLHWAEGSKHRNAAQIANSDSAVIALFARFLRHYFAAPEAALRVACNLFADHEERQREIEDFWLRTVDVPRACLTKSSINTYSRASKRKRIGRLPYGTCRLTFHSTRAVQHIYGAIQEYGGFERPEWLG